MRYQDLSPPHLQRTESMSSPFDIYVRHSSGQRIFTPATSIVALRHRYPKRPLTSISDFNCDLLQFAGAGNASCTAVTSKGDLPVGPLSFRAFVPPDRRHTDEAGRFADQIIFAAYDYKWEGKEFVLYVEDSRDTFARLRMFYLLGAEQEAAVGEGNDADADKLVAAATRWMLALHKEMLVFDGGFWRKDKELWKSIEAANWDDVILEAEKKKALQDDVDSFFANEQSYADFAVPWKRGLIFYGPPGNGKTISIRALMNSASKSLEPSIEMLYVKSFVSRGAIAAIFQKARQVAPCILIFEDIDSLVTDAVRSYFLNAVDGLESNTGILMIGSTNHLERLDPGIAKRPSRFDRKFFFSMPDRNERIQYCQYWRNKLKDNKKVEFPEELCGMIADITGDFSFAYLKEAFVAALLKIVAARNNDGKGKAEDTILWKQIKIQIKILRDEMETDSMLSEKPEKHEEEKASPLLQKEYLQQYRGMYCMADENGGHEPSDDELLSILEMQPQIKYSPNGQGPSYGSDFPGF